jgi:hypothetical protein
VVPARPTGYQFTPHDYAAYLLEKAAILSQLNGRAALLRGGIVWRLARQILSPDDALRGPSSAVTAGRVGYSTDKLEAGLALLDDDLPLVEVNLICGVYECQTGLPIVTPLSHIHQCFSDCSFRPWESNCYQILVASPIHVE